jgi:predicted nucleic acid-binding protein
MRGFREVLVDEVSARMAAKLMGLTPRGTVYVLLRALEFGEFSLGDFLDALSGLVEHGFRLREEVYLKAVKKAREISKETGTWLLRSNIRDVKCYKI